MHSHQLHIPSRLAVQISMLCRITFPNTLAPLIRAMAPPHWDIFRRILGTTPPSAMGRRLLISPLWIQTEIPTLSAEEEGQAARAFTMPTEMSRRLYQAALATAVRDQCWSFVRPVARPS